MFPSTHTTNQSAVMATIALAGTGYFILAVIALHFLRLDLHPLYRYISEYAVGSFGWLMTSAFVGLSLASFALTLGLYQKIAREGRSWAGLVLLMVWSSCILVAAFFKTDLINAAETREGNIHSQFSLISFISLIISTFFLLRFRKDTAWEPYYRFSLLLSMGMVLSFSTLFWTIFTGHAMVGFTQRIFISMVLLWLLQMAMHLRSVRLPGNIA